MSKDAAITNNLGVVALMNGDLATAQKYLSALNNDDSKASMGLVNLAEGNSAEAATTLSGYEQTERQLVQGQVDSGRRELGRCRLSEGCHRYARG